MALQEVGVEAIVKGLAAFQGDMKKMNSSLQGLRGEGTLLQRAFGSITEGIVNFGASLVRVAEVALGVLLRDAIRAAIDFVRELITATIDAGNEFQVLEIRLERLNFNTLIESGTDYNQAASEAVKLTKEQLKWLQLLAAQSPYDATDVANVFTLARSYGFAGEQAQGMTQDILDFAAGMGLGSQEIQRIIVNFGQMVQQGKVTQREMNDLARGSFVPVNDVLKIMQKRTGLAGKEFDAFRNSGEGVTMFMSAFSELVEKRFAGGAEQMSNTFKAATDNVMDLVKGIFGLNTVRPILDSLGKRAAAFANAFTDDPQRWDRLVAAASRLGTALTSVLTSLFDLMPSTEGLADSVIQVVERAAAWVEDNRENIIGFFVDIADTIRNEIVPWIRDQLIPAIGQMFAWINDNKDLFLQVFLTLGEVIRDVVVPALVEEVIPALQNLLTWITENKETVKIWIDFLIKAFLAWQVISTVLNVVIGIILSVIGFVLGLVATISGLISIISFLGSGFLTLITVVGAVIGIFTAFKMQLEIVKTVVGGVTTYIEQRFGITKDAIVNNLRWAWEIAKNLDWGGLGRAIVSGIANGIVTMVGYLARVAANAAMSAYNAARSALGIQSPSKLFMDIGAETMQGMALGIQKSAGLAALTMQGAMARVSSAAVPSVTNSTVYNSTANYNLTVNSGAPTEPILQDFNMMSSLAGV